MILLWYCGMATVFRESAYRYQLTGLPWKRLDQLGFDYPVAHQSPRVSAIYTEVSIA